jgi:hypothetical protein
MSDNTQVVETPVVELSQELSQEELAAAVENVRSL